MANVVDVTVRGIDEASSVFRNIQSSADSAFSNIESSMNSIPDIDIDATVDASSATGSIADIEGAAAGAEGAINSIPDPTVDSGQAEGELNNLGDAADDAQDSIDKIDLGGIVGGLAAGGGLAGIVSKALDMSSLDTQIDMSFNIPEESVGAVKSSIKQVQSYGVDAEGALEGVRKQFALNSDASDESNQNIIAGAGAITAAFSEVDFSELIQESNEIGKELNMSQEDALGLTNELIKIGFPPGEIDTIAEYGKQLADTGYEAGEIQAIMKAGVETGTWSIDNLLDGLKEGKILIGEFGAEVDDSTAELLEGTDISASQLQEWGKAVSEGGEGGKKAMTEVARALDGVEDGAQKNLLGVKLFGTMYEEQGSNITDTLLNAEGATADLKVGQEGVNDAVAAMEASPAVQMEQAMQSLNKTLAPIFLTVSKVVGAISTWVSENPILAGTIAAISVALGIITGVLMALGPVIAGVKGAMLLFNASLLTSPITWIILGIMALIAVIVLLWANWDEVSAFLSSSWKAIMAVAKVVWGGLVTFFKATWEVIKVLFKVGVELLKTILTAGFNIIKSVISAIWGGIKTFFSAVWDGIVAIVTGGINLVKSIISAIFNVIKTVIMTIWNGIKAFFGLVWQGIVTVVTTYINIVRTIITTIFNVIKTIITTIWNTIKTVTTTVWNALVTGVTTAVNLLKTGISVVFNAIKTAITTAWNFIKTTTMTVWNSIVSVVTEVINRLKSGITIVFNTIKTVISTVWNAIKLATTTVWNIIVTLVTSVINRLKTGITNIFNAIKSTITTVWNTIKTVSTTVWNAIINVVTAVINRLRNGINNIFNAIKSTITTIWNTIKSVSSNVWNSIVSVVTGVINRMKSTMSNVFNSIKSTVTNIWNTIKSVSSNVWNGIKSSISGIINGISSAVTGTFNTIKRTISGVWTGIKNSTSSIWSGIVSAVKSPINSIIGMINSMISKINGVSIDLPKIPDWVPKIGGMGGGNVGFNIPSIPALATGGVVSKPTLAMVGDAGRGNPEIVAPQKMIAGLIGQELGNYFGNMKSGGSSGQPTEIIIPINLEGREIARVTAPFMDRELGKRRHNKTRAEGG